MVRVVDCDAGLLGSNPGGPKRFSPWNYFTGGNGKLFSNMVRVVDCHAGVLGLNPGGPRRFSPWNYFTWLEWSTVMREFWVQILADPGYFPLGITSILNR